jgi:hypothetical protein
MKLSIIATLATMEFAVGSFGKLSLFLIDTTIPQYNLSRFLLLALFIHALINPHSQPLISLILSQKLPTLPL